MTVRKTSRDRDKPIPFALSVSKGLCHGSTGSPRTGLTNSRELHTGWKDSVLLMPGEAARLLLRFEDFTGLYLYHCHNLEHEDLGMMRNYRVVA